MSSNLTLSANEYAGLGQCEATRNSGFFYCLLGKFLPNIENAEKLIATRHCAMGLFFCLHRSHIPLKPVNQDTAVDTVPPLLRCAVAVVSA